MCSVTVRAGITEISLSVAQWLGPVLRASSGPDHPGPQTSTHRLPSEVGLFHNILGLPYFTAYI